MENLKQIKNKSQIQIVSPLSGSHVTGAHETREEEGMCVHICVYMMCVYQGYKYRHMINGANGPNVNQYSFVGVKSSLVSISF